MPSPSDPARLSGRSPFLAHWVGRALRHRVKGSFSRVRWSGDFPLLRPRQGIILYTNHPSWWDPALFSVIQQHFMPNRPGFGPIDAQAVKNYPLLRKAGFLPLDGSSPRSVRQLLDASSLILKTGGAFWVTAQGAFADARARPIRLQPGLAHIIRRNPEALVVPVALDYAVGTESRPDIAIRFGAPMKYQAQTIEALTADLALHLEQTCDALAEQVIGKQDEAFRPLMDGRTGMGGPYSLIQRLVALLHKRRHEPSHARR
ncbi:lysophospholipid acyltransferase family protein [Asaia spathodeae]|uniref:Phospholipid/glycerol acyltransferase domain-containing protein n=1 Tax=Asaia spathodeae TaxID=657016 RepID=A0ABX2P631_9PROT|nr:lysophospholipid acyltransferase family protein [Asaia spathodeae]